MKKFLSIALCAVLGLGTLGMFAGCNIQLLPHDPVEGEEATEHEDKLLEGEAREEVLSSVSAAEFSAFELSVSSTANTELTNRQGTYQTTTTQDMQLQAYEKRSQVYADLFMITSVDTVSREGPKRTTDSADVYAISFWRGPDMYTQSGNWWDVSVALEVGDFDGLLGKIRSKNLPFAYTRDTSTNTNFDTTDFGTASAESYLDLGEFSNEVVYSTQEGYRIEYDFVSAAGNIFTKLKDVSVIYKKNSSWTIDELFNAAGLEGMAEVLFGGELPGEIPASLIFGKPNEFAETVESAAADPEKFLLEIMFGLELEDGDKGALSYTGLVLLDEEKAITEINVCLFVSAEMQRVGVETSISSETAAAFTILTEMPELTDLKGLTADMGYLPKVGAHEFSTDFEITCVVGYGDVQNIPCTITATLNVKENGWALLNVTAEFEEGYIVSGTVSEEHLIDLSQLRTGNINSIDLFCFEKIECEVNGTSASIGTFGQYIALIREGNALKFYIGGISFKIPGARHLVTL